MSLKTTTHLNFRGQAKQALGFYQSVFGGNIALVTYRDAHAVQLEAEADQILWGQVASSEGFRIMAYDVPASLPHDQGVIPFFVSIRVTDQAELKGYWNGLCDGGVVVADLAPSGWSPLYGMVRDRFGVTWVLDIEVAYGG
ncbi:VOC family protein [Thalassospira marina]|uniref:Bleomycin resistance protein n=1 Tax=Thalassospira marina TaxID=2048283 RepID=A0A2N3KWP1_9PROT|nr:VOC family protein [Thalassospira marina]PKR54910.1 bleomycin resistance protein [Thalassospira marina]